jgi:putative transposase
VSIHDQIKRIPRLKAERLSLADVHSQEPIASPRFFRRGERALAKMQRRLAKHPTPRQGERQSPARRKAKKAVGHVHERIAHQRVDFAHQHSRQIVNTYGFICVEDLSINQMVHNHCLAKSIQDAAWRQFIAALTYKAEWAGRRVVAVNPAYTSQDCSCCGHREPKDLGERVHRCSCCGLVLDRDHNAALNLLRVGLHSLAQA